MSFLELLSAVFGWVYTLCWSLSFYPQPILNFQRKSTAGTTIDFPLINPLGFLAYLISNLAFFYAPLIRAQYAARNHGLTPTVQPNDVAFSAHALVLSSITLSQYLFPRLWRFTPRRTDHTHSASVRGYRPSRFIAGTMLACIIYMLVMIFVVLSSPGRDSTGDAVRASWAWIDVVYAIGNVKLIVTLVKFTPQVVINFRNKSTRGWSIGQITLDFIGGVLSTAQLAIDSHLQGDWSGLTGNPVKLLLGNVSIAYDIIFFVQHYILYRGSEAKESETDPLIQQEGDEEERRID